MSSSGGRSLLKKFFYLHYILLSPHVFTCITELGSDSSLLKRQTRRPNSLFKKFLPSTISNTHRPVDAVLPFVSHDHGHTPSDLSHDRRTHSREGYSALDERTTSSFALRPDTLQFSHPVEWWDAQDLHDRSQDFGLKQPPPRPPSSLGPPSSNSDSITHSPKPPPNRVRTSPSGTSYNP